MLDSVNFTIREFNKRLKPDTRALSPTNDFTIREFNKRLKQKKMRFYLFFILP